MVWLSLADLGLGADLTSSLSVALARRDSRGARELIASAFWTLVAAAAVLLAVVASCWPAIDWGEVFGVHSPAASVQVSGAMAAAVALFCISLPFSVVDRVLTALQRGGAANGWGVAASLASLLGVLAAVRSGGGLVAMVVATSGALLAVRLLSAAWLFARSMPELSPAWSASRGATSRRLLSRGKEFLLVQISALVLYSTDSIIIARVLGADHVTPYAVSWRLFSIPGLLLTSAFPYLWAAYAEALTRGDLAWVRRTLRLATIGATAFAALTALPLVVFGRDLIRFWAGSSAVPPQTVLVWMGAWSVLLAPANSIICLLNAANKVRWQIWVGLLSAAANIALSVWWARLFGISGVIAATVVSYLAFAAAPVTVAGMKLIRSLPGSTAVTPEAAAVPRRG
jgi:O-antigen/teichoic acid export membrane protein